MSGPKQISRRVVLKGIGLSLALPWLESGHLHADETSSPSNPSPQRFACLFVGDGISPPLWWAKGSGADLELGPSLKSLTPFKEKLNVISGLYNRNAGGGHAQCTGNILSGVALKRGRVIEGAVTMDQKLAQHLDGQTAVPSLVLGCENPVSGFHESEYSMVYASHVSWSRPDSPIPIELHPSLAFDSLFGKGSSALQGSILDSVLSQAKDLRRQVSRHDQGKIDDYLGSVRETELRLKRLNQSEGVYPTVDPSLRPPTGQPKDFRDYARLMCDVIALAFQTDRTRLATLLLSRDLSGQVYPFLNLKDDHHSYSHSNTEPEFQSIVNCQVEQYAYLLSRLDSMKEGDSTVLDNSCIMFVSEHWNAHNADQVPVVLAGGLGGKLRTGRSSDYLRAGNDNRKLCSLYLSLMDRMGLELPSFGDANERLSGV